MAKVAAKTETKTTSKGDDYKFGVEDLADKLGIEPASARIKLRNAGVKKAPTGRYGWKTKADLEEVVDELKSTKSAPAKKEAPAKSSKRGKSDEDEEKAAAPKATKRTGKR